MYNFPLNPNHPQTMNTMISKMMKKILVKGYQNSLTKLL
ncbi:hypothetical protein SD77_0977 [Bacillus badius]|uniref:Uncharacterized protein n=1 Tax=Bacillus badius TaxID=1455 RepID=A0ABR5ATC2_BACBA|nr:hypothetical protein SD77_0977 [Bacillus badius]